MPLSLLSIFFLVRESLTMNNNHHHHHGNSHPNNGQIKPDFFSDRQEEQLFRQIAAEENLVRNLLLFISSSFTITPFVFSFFGKGNKLQLCLRGHPHEVVVPLSVGRCLSHCTLSRAGCQATGEKYRLRGRQTLDLLWLFVRSSREMAKQTRYGSPSSLQREL